jgi:hypothetical protein
LLEDSQDLVVAELGSLHAELPPGEQGLLLRPPVGWGHYRASSSRRIAVVVGIAVLPRSRSQAGTRGFNAMFGRSARALLARHVGRSCLHPACYLGITLIDWMRLLCRASR